MFNKMYIQFMLFYNVLAMSYFISLLGENSESQRHQHFDKNIFQLAWDEFVFIKMQNS